MDTHATAARLKAVHHKVVGMRTNGQRIGIQKVNLIFIWLRKGHVL